METIEKMTDFFTSRVEGYDEHMLNTVEGCRDAYKYMATLVPDTAQSLLDLGCGTGLELDEIFKIHPTILVTGIDLTQAMLDKLRQKHPQKNMNLLCGSYFELPFGSNIFDCAVSFQTLHHFTHEKKTGLYRKLYDALKTGSIYIECDYMVESQEAEELYFRENERIRREMGLSDDEFYHYDTPCTITNQITMLKTAGFSNVKQVFREENTTILVAEK